MGLGLSYSVFGCRGGLMVEVLCTYCDRVFNVAARVVGEAANCWIVSCGHRVVCPGCSVVYRPGRILGNPKKSVRVDC